MIPVSVIDGKTSVPVKVTASGELVVGPLHYDETEFNELAEPDTAYNFYQPKSGQQFVITGMLAFGDKQINGVTNATVVVYEATNTDVTTVQKVLLQFEMGQNQSIPMAGLRILVAAGAYVNAKTDDDDVHMTLLGYYIEEL